MEQNFQINRETKPFRPLVTAGNGGICTHSSNWFYEPVAVFSIDHPSRLRCNQFKAWLADRNVWHHEVAGQYTKRDDGGTIFEPAFVMMAEDTVRLALDVTAWMQGQESVLYLGAGVRRYVEVGRGRERFTTYYNARPAELVFNSDGHSEKLGDFHEVTREFALAAGEFTFDFQNNTYFAVTPTAG